MKQINLLFLSTTIIFTIILINSCNCFDIKIPTDNYVIPDSIISFFPHLKEKDNGVDFIFASNNAEGFDLPYHPVEFEIMYIANLYKYSQDSTFYNTVNKLISEAIVQLDSVDSDYNVIGSESEMIQRYNIKELENYYHENKNDFFVLDFKQALKLKAEIIDDSSESGLHNDYDIYIIDYGNIFILEDKYRFEWDILPDDLKHGHTTGVAINITENCIIYWAVAW